MYADVLVDIAAENVAHTFTYAVPDGMELSPGQRVLVPFGPRRIEGFVLGFSDETNLDEKRIRAIQEVMEDWPVILPPLMGLAQEMAGQYHCPLVEVLRLMYPAEMRGQRIRIKTEMVARLMIPKEELDTAIQSQGRSQRRKMLLCFLMDGRKHAVEEIRQDIRDPLPDLRRLAEQNLIELRSEEVLRQPGGPVPEDKRAWPDLTELQQEVLGTVLPSLKTGEGVFLLHGVTGSGKTEVFMRLVQEALRMGKSAIILVPEIALTPQMTNWFRARFGEGSAVLHSRLSAGERYDEWRRIRRGDAKVVIGARSAVFAPLDNLGLIVVDEEHERTYLSDRHPRYDAREVARARCRREKATLLLASATPSVESFYEARQGRAVLLDMPFRIEGRPLPEVEVVDMRKELDAGNRSIFSRSLLSRLTVCLRKGEQVMLLMNHRGYSSFVSCRSCGHVIKCPSCDVSLTYHVGGQPLLRCHYCGHTERLPQTCPVCQSDRIRHFGAGTQQVEAEVKKYFPNTRVLRMDMDTTSGKDGHAVILEQFRSGEAQVLVGTQMIAKGLDFPNVTLVGVIAADMTLNLPDYRAKERTFQLLTQVAGRAGRGTIPGSVVIQTYRPEDPVIQASSRQDYRGFFEMELERRRVALYPPFTVMARLLVESEDPVLLKNRMDDLERRCQAFLDQHPECQKACLMLHRQAPPLSKLRGRVREHLVMKLHVSPETEVIAEAFAEMSRETVTGADTYFEYNPTAML